MDARHFLTIILFTIFSLCRKDVRAYDFSYTYQGKTLYYTITSSSSVEVTYDSLGSNYVNGDLIIPSQVTYNDTIYNVTSISSSAFSGCSSLTNIDIPSSVTTIGSLAFQWCTSLKSIEIPSSITDIGEHAFLGCWFNIDTITINSNSVCKRFWGLDLSPSVLVIGGDVTAIEDDAFKFCSNLDSVVINSSITSIGKNAFRDCISLASINLPSSITSIGEGAFDGCCGLANIELPIAITTINESTFNACTSLENITIPSSVTSIGNWAFNGCINLKSIDLPASITTFGVAAFQGCISLENILLPTSITSIDMWAFNNCSSLTNIEIPSSLTSVSSYSFYGCIGLKSITIPSSVTDIEDYAFGECINVDTITINSNNVCKKFWEDNDMSPKVLKIGDNITTIDNWAFYDCNSLTNIELPNTITALGNNAFNGCTSLESILLPTSITSIGTSAFYNCTSLDTIIYKSLNPPTIDASTFGNIPQECILFVLCEAIDIYKTTQAWNTFTNIHSFDTIFEEIDITICANETYDFYGQILSQAGTYKDTILDDNGCTNVVTLNLSINPYNTADTTINISIDNNETYTFGNKALSIAGTYIDTLQTINGCDSVVTLTLSINPIPKITTTATICDNQTYQFGGRELSEAGTYTYSLISEDGYKSIVILTLNVLPTFDTVIEQISYEGDTVNFMGNKLTSAGIYKYTLTAENGCDSIISLKLFTLPRDTIKITQYDTIILRDTIIDVDTLVIKDTITLYDTITNTIHDTITNIIIDTLTQIIYDTIIPCAEVYTYIYATINSDETYTEHGFVANTPGTYTFTVQYDDGCDSVIVLYLSVLSGIEEVESSQITMYPNPTKEKVYLTLTNLPDAMITIRDVQGKVVKDYKVLPNETDIVLDVKDLERGIYTIMIHNDKTQLTKKLIIQ